MENLDIGTRNPRPAGIAAALAASLALTACNGPWNMDPDAEPRPLKLWASALLVADRPLDTLWLERPIALGRAKDPAAPFVDAASSRVAVIGEGRDTVRFRPAPGAAAAWIPEDTAYRVKRGARYELVAEVRWNAAPDYPAGSAWRSGKLRAATVVPRTFAFDTGFQVPVEALHRTLSLGLPAGSTSRAASDAAYRDALYDSLASLPGAGGFAAKVTRAAFAEHVAGRTAHATALPEDTLHYIFDAGRAVDYTGRVQHRHSLAWLFTTRNDGGDFGGIILSQRFDPLRKRILDPIMSSMLDVFGGELDSAEYFQSGDVRPVIIGGPYFAGIKGYPDTLRLTNLLLGYTGRTVMRGYAVDPLYWEYYRTLWQSGSEQMGGFGGGNTRAQNVLRETNVENGDGYFCGAVADSIAFHVEAARDTLDNAALKAAWEARKAREGRAR